ncbi:MAG: diphthamide synthesis protein [Candidatus Altiarchaeota archaeon]
MIKKRAFKEINTRQPYKIILAMDEKYDLEVDRIIAETKKSKARIVGLQFPEGIKKHAVEVAAQIEEKTGAKTIIFIDPTYGACDLKTEQAEKLGVDLLVHFGHSEYEKKR